MNWFFLTGSGRSVSAGIRPSEDSANGNAVMYDARMGKILTFGGSKAYSQPMWPGRGDTVIITIHTAGQQVEAKVVSSLNVPRVYANAMVMPDGKVAVVGGSELPKEFSDATPVMDPGVLWWSALPQEMWSLLWQTYLTEAGALQRSGTQTQSGGRSCKPGTRCPAPTTPRRCFCKMAAFCTAVVACAATRAAVAVMQTTLTPRFSRRRISSTATAPWRRGPPSA